MSREEAMESFDRELTVDFLDERMEGEDGNPQGQMELRPFGLDVDEMTSIAARVLAAVEVDRPCMVSVTIVDEERQRQLNRTWRNIDRSTDVLSFECEHPWDEDLAAGETCELGDIVFAPDYIHEQSRRFDTTYQDECRLLFIHGLLHLLGYDHEDQEEAVEMQALEEEILSQIHNDGSLKAHVLALHRQGE